MIFFVDQEFPYVRREEEAEVLECFKDRIYNRNRKGYTSRDKKVNPIVALPGSPGIGKSTFLMHFPLYSGYTAFCGQH
jgi:hypothetical protein